MSLRQIEEVMKDSGGRVGDKKDNLISKLHDDDSGNPAGAGKTDSSSALQLFLNHIPISSIPGIRNPPVLELKTGDSLRDAIRLLYEKNVSGAPIADVVVDPNAAARRFSDRYIGFIDFASMLLWSLERSEKDQINTEGDGDDNEASSSGIFSMLEQNPHIGQTKVGELAKSFLWDPFLPVNLDDTLFHVLLLLSKHRLKVVPVIEQSDSQVIGFVTQNAVIQLLLQSSGLEWFDNIANKALTEFRLENEDRVPQAFEDQSIAEALHILWESQISAVAVVNRETNRLTGCVRSSDVHLLLDNGHLFHNRKSISVEQFIHLDGGKLDSDPTIEQDLGALLLEGILRLKNSFLPRMDLPVINKKTDTLKQAMKNMAETKSNFSFLVDERQQATGVLTLREIIVQFAPPCVDSRINGVGFFESALEQSGCHVEGGSIVCNH
ncbi:SNF1-related protein kinase regulatory subunit gamma-1-like [Malania oleifera]|uniref:SNF1-related protein kinase regulatory subunit gamma-1-like n=1 Tax=Malania oleifera TaxID=397392 RepID=UPI0025AE5C5F|nr:SNF1-related protein kinase regulatory subunit gamma-1-like [Malania oleifera]